MIATLRAEQDALCQEIAEGMNVWKRIALEKDRLVRREVEELKT